MAPVLVLGFLLTGCGGGGVEPEEWAADVCGSWKSLETSLRKASTRLQTDMADPNNTDKAVGAYLSSVEDGVQRMEADIENAGVPDVENGQQVRKRLLAVVHSTAQAFTKARTTAEATDMSDPTQAMKVFADLSRDMKDMTEARKQVQSAELKKAFEQVPACEGFAS